MSHGENTERYILVLKYYIFNIHVNKMRGKE